MTKQKVEIGGKWFEAELNASGDPVLSEVKFEKGVLFKVDEVKHLLNKGDNFFVLRFVDHIDHAGRIVDKEGNYTYNYEQIMLAGDEV